MKTRIVHTKVWRDEWFVNLSKEAKLLWIYLLTNDKINISGIYEISDRELKFDLGFEVEDKIKQELKPKALFCKGWVFIPNTEKYNSYRNSPKNQTAFTREILCIPDTILQELGNDTSIGTSICTPPILLEIRNQKSEYITHKSKEEEEGKKELGLPDWLKEKEEELA